MEDLSVEELTQQMMETIRNAANKMTGAEHRTFEVQFSKGYSDEGLPHKKCDWCAVQPHEL